MGVTEQTSLEMKTASRSNSRRRTLRHKRAPANAEDLHITRRDIALLRQSFERIEPQAAIASLVFYRNLFTAAPELRPMFQSSIELQGRKFMEALHYTVTTIEYPSMLVPVLEALGRRHVSYGTRDEHYGIVVKVLLQTLKEILAGRFTPATRKAWKVALEFVAEVMRRGAAPIHELKSKPI
jgi:hemoglobin-like flavoprotein